MKKESCELIRDLLPLYEDGVASEEAQNMVREHLKECPACRDELDKLRTPVSLPPEEDKEQKIRERLRQSVKELKRRRRIKVAVSLAALAVLVLSCLWYTRPMTLDELCPGLDRDQAVSLSGSYHVYETQPDGRVDTMFQTINLYGDEAAEAIEELFQILDSCTYRRSLTSLLPQPTVFTSRANNPYWWNFAVGGGLSLSMDSFFPHKLNLTYNNGDSHTEVFCTVEDQEALYREVYLLLEGLSLNV